MVSVEELEQVLKVIDKDRLNVGGPINPVKVHVHVHIHVNQDPKEKPYEPDRD